MIKFIKEYFIQNKVVYSSHARYEMKNEEKGIIKEEEVFEAVLTGEEIISYPDDKPYPSCLLLGLTKNKRFIHIVIAVNKKEHIAIVVTAYEPDEKKWINFRKRRIIL